ncbi:MAG: hypothetical protein NC548_34345, partial [Lachnospiraceae bacterium]|nr:hypothetical protein [Lachnospiraceae bacterium]
ENLTDKVREKKMAELFENMEKLDIQAERRNTEEQRKRAETAEEKLEVSEQRLEAAITLLVQGYQAAGMSREEALKKLTEDLKL